MICFCSRISIELAFLWVTIQGKLTCQIFMYLRRPKIRFHFGWYSSGLIVFMVCSANNEPIKRRDIIKNFNWNNFLKLQQNRHMEKNYSSHFIRNGLQITLYPWNVTYNSIKNCVFTSWCLNSLITKTICGPPCLFCDGHNIVKLATIKNLDSLLLWS